MESAIMLRPYIVRKQMRDNFLKPARKQTARLQKYGPTVVALKKLNGQDMVVLNDSTWIPESHYYALPDVYLRQLIEDFWQQFELTLLVVHHPFSYMGLRSLYEHAYKKIITYVKADESTQRTIATKSWLCTLAMFMVRVTDGEIHDKNDLRKYNEFLSLLKGDDRASYTKLRDDNFPNDEVHAKMNLLFGRGGVPKSIRSSTQYLSHPILEHPPVEAIIANYNMMHGYTHLNTAHASYSRLIVGEQKFEHLRRVRTSLSLVSYQMLSLVNNLGIIPNTDITKTRQFISTIGKNAVKDLA